jgi:hypothetical protein
MQVTVVRAVPPLIVGACGVVPNREFEAFEERLDALEATGVMVERVDPADVSTALARIPGVQRLVAARGERCFPLTAIDDEVIASGRYPTRAEWAHAIGTHKRHELTTR